MDVERRGMKAGRLVFTHRADGTHVPIETNLTGAWDKDGKRFVVPFGDRNDVEDCLRLVIARLRREQDDNHARP
jgi:hypothetical protein